ncbi:hypothetical protein RUM44_010692 [Polyplax serrata]|uniref:Uncharacterized protein n=1 Tax=Polyplax serrata TaxID=468196 RepID=A0ABR1AN10_POLSC
MDTADAERSIFNDALILIATVIKEVQLPSSEIKPNYDREYSEYSKALLKQISEFQKARSHFEDVAATSKPQEVQIVEEGEESNVYRGRCLLLTKIGFKTNRLRTHYKTLRPFKYYTLNRDLPLHDLVEDENPEEDDLFALKKKERKKKRKKIKEVIVKESKKPPSLRILERLRATKKKAAGQSLVHCRCENSKEVTFIIKGVCLCNKSNFKSLTSGACCGEYCQSQLQKMTFAPRAVDSLEIIHTRLHSASKKNEFDENTTKKGVKFTEVTESDEKLWPDYKVEPAKPEVMGRKKSEKEVKFADEISPQSEERPESKVKIKEKLLRTEPEESFMEKELDGTDTEEAIAEKSPGRTTTEETMAEKRLDRTVTEETVEEKRLDRTATEETMEEKRLDRTATEETVEEKRLGRTATEETVEEKRPGSTATEETVEEKRPDRTANEETVEEKRLDRTETDETIKNEGTTEEDEFPAKKDRHPKPAKTEKKELKESKKSSSLILLFRSKAKQQKSKMALTKELGRILKSSKSG